MNRFIRYFNQNRKKIIISVAIIAFIIIIIRIIDSIYAKINISKIDNIIVNNENQPTESVITGETVSQDITSKNQNEIDNFINYCNNKQYNQAYELLTDECKQEYNNDVNKFKENYANKIFLTKKTYNIELWLHKDYEYTYKVTLYNDDLLATGGKNINTNYQDYITVSRKNDQGKININGFIKRNNIDKSIIVNNIEVVVNSQKIYKNYEVYNLIIRNRSDKTIALTNEKNGKDICIVDENNVEYQALLNDTSIDQLKLRSAFEKNIDIKFNKIYDNYKVIKKIKLKNVIMDYEKYLQNNKDKSVETTEIEINVK